MTNLVGYHASTVAMAKEQIMPGRPGKDGPAALGLWLTDSRKSWQAAYGVVFNRVEITPEARVLHSTSREIGTMAHTQHGGDWGKLSLALQADYDVVVMGSAHDGSEIVVLAPAAVASIEVA